MQQEPAKPLGMKRPDLPHQLPFVQVIIPEPKRHNPKLTRRVHKDGMQKISRHTPA
jgi:hypothetical protein